MYTFASLDPAIRRILGFGAMAFGLFVTLAFIDVLKGDAAVSLSVFALDMLEKALLALAIVTTAYVTTEMRDIRAEREVLLDDLARARIDGDRWRSAARTHIDGLGLAIRRQFEVWSLTASEADVATLMLKGLSHKEIAQLRNTSAATVRQQSTAIYAKSGLSSRAELAAYFLEDLLAGNAAPSMPPQPLAVLARAG